MSNLKLYINDKPVILKPDSGIYLNYEANSLENLAQRSGTLSEEFELEDCLQNRQALGNLQILNSATNTPYELLPARIEVEYNHFMFGSASISEVSDSIPANFSSDNADFFQSIKDRLISEIDLTDLDHTWNAGNVQAANVHDPDRGYVYPLINYGRWGTRYLDPTNQHYTELFPAVYVRTLLERMAAPYTLAGSLLTEPRFQRLVIAFTNELFRYRESYRVNYDARQHQVTDILIPTSVAEKVIGFSNTTYDPSGRFQTSPDPHYLTPFRGKFRVKVRMVVTFNLPAGITNTFSLLADTLSYGTIELGKVDLPGGDNQVIEFDVVSPALVVDSQIYIHYQGQVNPANRVDVYILDGATFEVQLHEQVMEGGAVHLDANLPEITQDKLLASVVNAFDVVIQTNDLTKTIHLDLRRDMISRPEVDWTGKIDFAKRPKINFKPEFYAQKNIYTWADHETNDINGNPVRESMQVQVYNQNSEPEKDAFVSPFTHTVNASAFRGARNLPLIPLFQQMVISFGLFRESVPYKTEDYVYSIGNYWLRRGDFTPSDPPPVFNGPTDPGWTLMQDEDVFARHDLSPRLLVMEELPEADAIQIGDHEIPGSFAPVQWSAAFFTTDPDLSLAYDALRVAYLNILERILAKPKFITLMMRLTPADITTLDFMRPVAINRPELNLQGLFYLRKVNQYNPAERAAVAVDLALIGRIPVTVTDTTNREHSEEYSEEYA